MEKQCVEAKSTSFCASPARLRNAVATCLADIFLFARRERISSGGASVISTSSPWSSSFGMAETFNGRSAGGSGTWGCTVAIDASRYFCLPAATSSHVAPDSVVTDAAAIGVIYYYGVEVVQK
jgi:hypothetical protein